LAIEISNKELVCAANLGKNAARIHGFIKELDNLLAK
jgi:hypothetical protein